jgi:hypothetical protein
MQATAKLCNRWSRCTSRAARWAYGLLLMLAPEAQHGRSIINEIYSYTRRAAASQTPSEHSPATLDAVTAPLKLQQIAPDKAWTCTLSFCSDRVCVHPQGLKAWAYHSGVLGSHLAALVLKNTRE